MSRRISPGRNNRPAGRTAKPGVVSLDRALSKLGLASRTRARALILAGEVRVNGVVRRDPAYRLTPERARLEIGGQTVERAARRSFLLHKPRGTVTTRADEKGRPTVFSLLKGVDQHLGSVGRLDFATTGLLILTNDTRLAAWLTDPVNAVPRTYVVTVRGEVKSESLARMRGGIVDGGEKGAEVLRAEAVELRKASGRESHLTVVLSEGKNREIRRLFRALGHEVTRLKRVAYGALELGALAPGEYRELTADELTRAFPGAPVGAA